MAVRATVSFAANAYTFAVAPRAVFQWRACKATRAAVEGVPQSVDARTATKSSTRWASNACPLIAVRGLSGANVSAGAAVVRIRIHAGACPVATGRPCGATDEVATASTEAVGVAVARPAGRHALIPPLPGRTRPAESSAPVRPGSPGGPDPQRTEYSTGQNGPNAPQRFAARHRPCQQLRNLIETFHDQYLAS
jgi:hypothetical protein